MFRALADVIATLRFQVIIWNVGAPDVKNDRVSMKFRVTMFWNDVSSPLKKKESSEQITSPVNGEHGKLTNRKSRSHSIWVMAGRSAAFKKKISECPSDTIEVPPVSIINADTFDTIGQPEVQMLREDTRLMRWSCMYRAQLQQDDMSVREFPHDTHNLTLKLGILSKRQPGAQWGKIIIDHGMSRSQFFSLLIPFSPCSDRKKWMLSLANESDTQGTIAVPHGLIVDHVKIPEFHHDRTPDFEFTELMHGTDIKDKEDYYLNVKIRVQRESGMYDFRVLCIWTLSYLPCYAYIMLDIDGVISTRVLRQKHHALAIISEHSEHQYFDTGC